MNKHLLDTHVFRWAIADDSRLGPLSRELLLTGADVVLLSHLLTLEQLPQHHRDPFDRLWIAQAISESLTLLSADGAFTAYGGLLQAAWR